MTTEEPKQIDSIEDIQTLALSGFTDWKRYGDVNVSAANDLLIFCYVTRAQYEGRWNFFERVSRGLIINQQTGEVIARPFDKFFNWQEDGRSTASQIVSMTEKMDGSLGILYRRPDGYKIATKANLTSDQAIWATDFLRHYDLAGLPDELTLMFEIVYPENRIIVDYGTREDLVLLAARNRFTGNYLPFVPDVRDLAASYGFSLPQVYAFDSLEALISATQSLGTNHEGWVVEFADGSRFKFKSSQYLQLHKFLVGLTFKNVLAAVANKTIEQVFEIVPEEFLAETRQWIREIEETVESITHDVSVIFATAPKPTRKEFAQWVQQNRASISSYLFAMYDGRDITPLIYKHHSWPQAEQNQDK